MLTTTRSLLTRLPAVTVANAIHPQRSLQSLYHSRPLFAPLVSDETKDAMRQEMKRGQGAAESGAAGVAASAKRAGLQASEAAQEASVNMKQSASEAMERAREGADEAMGRVKGAARKLKKRAKKAAEDMSESITPQSESAMSAGEDMELSGHRVSKGYQPGQTVPGTHNPLVQGPQEMPQGVGRRAKDEKGRPMETGSERT